MEQLIKVTIKMVSNMGMVFSLGAMVRVMMEHFLKTIYMEKALINGQMEDYMSVSGKKI